MAKKSRDGTAGLRHEENHIIPGVDAMHTPSILCIASGLSWPYVGVIVALRRGYRGPNFFFPFFNPNIFNGVQPT